MTSNSAGHILAIDSSTSVLRVGLKLPDGDIISRENKDRFRHAEFIFQLIEDVLKTGSIDKTSLEAIVISTGPGSFTGLRVGMSAAKGLAVALNIPMIGVLTFSAVAKSLFEQFGPTAVLIPSRRDEFYFGLIEAAEFDKNSIVIIKTDEIESKLNNINVYGIDFDISAIQFPKDITINIVDYKVGIADFIAAGIEKYKTDGADDLFLLEPFYAQNFPVKRPK